MKVYPQNCHILGVKLDHILLYPKTIDISLTIKMKIFGKKFVTYKLWQYLVKHRKTAVYPQKSHISSPKICLNLFL